MSPAANEQRIRPTSDKVRGALFDILGSRVQDSAFLDFFSGTGGVGLEAFSRGAKQIIFVDNLNLALDLTKKNILNCCKKHLDIVEIRVIQHDLKKSLPLSALTAICPLGYDIIWADPPYNTGLSQQILTKVNDSRLLREDGLLIIEESRNVKLPEQLSTLMLGDNRIYGETVFNMYSCKNL